MAVPSASNTALHLKNVPDELNNKTFLSAHLGKFGKIKALKCFPEKRYATVEYYLRVCVYVYITYYACNDAPVALAIILIHSLIH